MCGRFEFKADPEYLEKIYNKRQKKLNPEFDPNIVLKHENIAPTDKIMVITLENDEYKLKIMKWAIKSKVRSDSKKTNTSLFGEESFIAKDIFNSRIETIKSSPDWRSLIYQHRCIVPMTAFYEWTGEKGHKQAQRIFIENDNLFFAAGIYKPIDITNQTGASIITCEPNTFMKPIHNRMPVLFQFDMADQYLNAQNDVVINLCDPLDDKIGMAQERAMI